MLIDLGKNTLIDPDEIASVYPDIIHDCFRVVLKSSGHTIKTSDEQFAVLLAHQKKAKQINDMLAQLIKRLATQSPASILLAALKHKPDAVSDFKFPDELDPKP